MNFQFIKKIIHYFILLSLIVLSLSACSNKQGQKNKDYNTSLLSQEQLKQKQYQEVLLSEYSTKLIGSDQDRNTNIDLACKSINGTIINPGDTFSFWDIVGKTTIKKGYKEADAFNSNGETIKALGGGICQVSSTIYNAVLDNKDLEVVERHPHSNYVAYVPKGRDASVNYNTADFKFKNNLDTPIKLYTRLENKKVIAEIYELK